MSITATLSGRMGPLAESPLGSYLVTSMALQSSNDWYQKRTIATTIYHSALGKLGAVPPMDHAKINALASAASKVIINVMRGVRDKPVAEQLDDALEAANKGVGAPDQYVNAVKEAALAYVGQVAAGPA